MGKLTGNPLDSLLLEESENQLSGDGTVAVPEKFLQEILVTDKSLKSSTILQLLQSSVTDSVEGTESRSGEGGFREFLNDNIIAITASVIGVTLVLGLVFAILCSNRRSRHGCCESCAACCRAGGCGCSGCCAKKGNKTQHDAEDLKPKVPGSGPDGFETEEETRLRIRAEVFEEKKKTNLYFRMLVQIFNAERAKYCDGIYDLGTQDGSEDHSNRGCCSPTGCCACLGCMDCCNCCGGRESNLESRDQSRSEKPGNECSEITTINKDQATSRQVYGGVQTVHSYNGHGAQQERYGASGHSALPSQMATTSAYTLTIPTQVETGSESGRTTSSSPEKNKREIQQQHHSSAHFSEGHGSLARPGNSAAYATIPNAARQQLLMSQQGNLQEDSAQDDEKQMPIMVNEMVTDDLYPHYRSSQARSSKPGNDQTEFETQTGAQMVIENYSADGVEGYVGADGKTYYLGDDGIAYTEEEWNEWMLHQTVVNPTNQSIVLPNSRQSHQKSNSHLTNIPEDSL